MRKITIPVLVCILMFALVACASPNIEDNYEDNNEENIPPIVQEAMQQDASPEPRPTPQLGVVQPIKPYNSDKLYADCQTLSVYYPEIMALSSIGQTSLGNDIPLLKLGNGDKNVLWVGTVHAREIVTSAYLMLVVEEYANAHYNSAPYGRFDADDTQRILNEFTIYIVPAVNIDGMDIVTANGFANVSISDEDRKTWRGNANGVDLNRNFPFDWINGGEYDVADNGYFYYKGESAGSEPETRALMSLCESVHFEFLVSCHVRGQIIYWRDEKNGVIPGDETLATTISKVTGYPLQPATSKAKDGWAGGFENWFRYRFNRPGICIEFARQYSTTSEGMLLFYTEEMMDWENTKDLILYTLSDG